MINSADIAIGIFDLLGKNVWYQKAQSLASGFNRLPLEISDMESGVYFVRIEIGEEMVTRKLMVR